MTLTSLGLTPPKEGQLVMRFVTGAVFAALLAAGTPAVAQIQGGNVAGVVRDQTHAFVPGATATLRGPDATRTIVSDGAGGFRFLDVAPGVYQLEVQLQGFRAFQHKNIVVGVGRTLAVNVELAIEGLTDSVTVTAPTPMLDARQTGTATNITENELTRI